MCVCVYMSDMDGRIMMYCGMSMYVHMFILLVCRCLIESCNIYC